MKQLYCFLSSRSCHHGMHWQLLERLSDLTWSTGRVSSTVNHWMHYFTKKLYFFNWIPSYVRFRNYEFQKEYTQRESVSSFHRISERILYIWLGIGKNSSLQIRPANFKTYFLPSHYHLTRSRSWKLNSFVFSAVHCWWKA